MSMHTLHAIIQGNPTFITTSILCSTCTPQSVPFACLATYNFIRIARVKHTCTKSAILHVLTSITLGVRCTGFFKIYVKNRERLFVIMAYSILPGQESRKNALHTRIARIIPCHVTSKHRSVTKCVGTESPL